MKSTSRRGTLRLLTALLFVCGISTPGMAAPDSAFGILTGFGADTKGGLDGRVIRVTTLDASGPGSLREALAASGPRIVVFEVGGVIDLDKQDLKLTQPYVTIAGQTAPSPGITLIRGGMAIQTHDVVMQHIRFRIGDAGMAKKTGFEKDVSIEGANAWNVVVDHCSVAWGTDENLSVSGPRYDGTLGTARRVTLSNNIIAEALHDSTHSKGAHSMGTLIHDNVTEVAVVGNLYAHNNDRNPWFKDNATGVIVNNFIYNPGTWAVRLGANPKEWEGRSLPANSRVAIVGNVMRHGENTPPTRALVGTNTANGDAWLADNIATDRTGKAAAQISGSITVLDAVPIWPTGLKAIPAADVERHVLAHAGARPRDRDAVDARIVEQASKGSGRFLNSQEEAGGYPRATATYRKLDVPEKDLAGWLQKLAAALQ